MYEHIPNDTIPDSDIFGTARLRIPARSSLLDIITS